jgi:hypothetical protein
MQVIYGQNPERQQFGGEVVSLTRQSPFNPRKIPATHFCYRLSGPQGHSAAGKVRSSEKSNDLIGNRTCDLAACSIVPQSTTLSRAPSSTKYVLLYFGVVSNSNTGSVYLKFVKYTPSVSCHHSIPNH